MTESRKPLDYWLPPEGAGRPIGCVATSFTFEVRLFETECLGRFLGLGGRRGEGDDLSFLIEEEERLAESRVCVLVDRSWSAEGHNLRWDVLPIAHRGGLQHSKTALMVWENLVRVLIGSANLTPAGYRRQVETITVLEAFPNSDVPRELFFDFIRALRQLVGRAPGESNLPGPKQRAFETLETADKKVRAFRLGSEFPERLRATIIPTAPGQPALEQIDRVWRGGPADSAMVVSPFFDASATRDLATGDLVERLRQRGSSKITYVVPVDASGSKTVVRAPSAILRSVPPRVEVDFRAFTPPEVDGHRHPHAKAVLLESDSWTALMAGSSNFTAAGMGLMREAGHLELNVAFGAPADSEEASQLRQTFAQYLGDPIDTSGVEWDSTPDDEDQAPLTVPWGFQECLLEPGVTPTLHFRFEIEELPGEWRIKLPSGTTILTSSEHRAAGRPAQISRSPSQVIDTQVLEVDWTEDGVEKRAAWPLNVTQPGRLPPPSELRQLSIDALLEALASTRPIHEAVAAAIRKEQKRSRLQAEIDRDPLRRFSQTGRLLQRARQLAMALEGLRRRLERPTTSLDALIWRLEGRFGPVAIAEGFAEEARQGRAVVGELDFILGEIVLTLSRVRWDLDSDLLSKALELVARIRDSLQGMRSSTLPDAKLAAYVEEAFSEAAR